MNILGIDIGSKGGIVVLNEHREVMTQVSMPYHQKTGLDLRALSAILEMQKHCDYAVFEQVSPPPKTSAKGAFSFGGSAMSIEMAVVLLKIPYTKVPAQRWQKELFMGVEPIYYPMKPKDKKRKKDTKSMALVAARRLFPDNDFKGKSTQHNTQDGIVDALLIAEYGLRLFKGELRNK